MKKYRLTGRNVMGEYIEAVVEATSKWEASNIFVRKYYAESVWRIDELEEA